MEVHMSDVDQHGNVVHSVVDNDLEEYGEIIRTLKSQGFDYISPPVVEFPCDGSWDGTNRTHILCITR